MGYRLVTALPVIFGIIVLNFLLIHLAPGDAASVLAGESGAATPEYMDALRHKFGLDQSLGMQFVTYVSNMAHLNLGYSYRNDADVSSLILERLGPTSLLMLTAFGTAVALGIILGLVAATGRNSWRDNIISLVSLVAYATPGFWLGLMMIVIFSIGLGWLPTSGFDTVGAGHEGWAEARDVARHLVMPAVSLALFYLALYARLMRASVLEQTGMDYVTTARAKGQNRAPRLTLSHVLRNAGTAHRDDCRRSGRQSDRQHPSSWKRYSAGPASARSRWLRAAIARCQPAPRLRDPLEELAEHSAQS